MKLDIKSKLETALSKDSFSETDVVYILSRIRKLLEIDRNRNFDKLKFYCDWALHTQIDNTLAVNDEIKTFIEDPSTAGSLFYSVFWIELKRFIKEYSLNTNLSSNYDLINQFQESLSDIYSDTSVIVKEVKKTKLTFRPMKRDKSEIEGKTYYTRGMEFKISKD